MTPDARARLRRLAEAATPGEWVRNGSFTSGVFVDGAGDQPVAEFETLRDAEFAMAANPAEILRLLDALDAAEGRKAADALIRDAEDLGLYAETTCRCGRCSDTDRNMDDPDYGL